MIALTIDPKDVIRSDRSLFELELKLIFDVCVAGKNADQISGKVRDLTALLLSAATAYEPRTQHTPFSAILAVGDNGLDELLRHVRMGQYTRIGRALWALATSGLDLSTCGVEDLERVRGIGPKTSRFFMLTNRPGIRYACLDVHVLRYLREEVGVQAPRSTPPAGPKYTALERAWLDHCDALGVDPAEHDLYVWSKYSGRLGAAERG